VVNVLDCRKDTNLSGNRPYDRFVRFAVYVGNWPEFSPNVHFWPLLSDLSLLARHSLLDPDNHFFPPYSGFCPKCPKVTDRHGNVQLFRTAYAYATIWAEMPDLSVFSDLSYMSVMSDLSFCNYNGAIRAQGTNYTFVITKRQTGQNGHISRRELSGYRRICPIWVV